MSGVALTLGDRSSRSKYSLSMRDSILFLRSEAWMGNLSCTSSSWTSSLWDRDLRVFMTRTMAASICRARPGEGLGAVQHSCEQIRP